MECLPEDTVFRFVQGELPPDLNSDVDAHTATSMRTSRRVTTAVASWRIWPGRSKVPATARIRTK
jgi:anti-sigma factor RsiW